MKLSIFSRMNLVGLIFSLVGIASIFQMIRIQAIVNIPANELEDEQVTLLPQRGSIYDRGGNLLAGSQVVYEISVDLRVYHNPETIAYTLNTVLGLDYSKVLESASWDPIKNGPPYNITLVDFVTQDKVDKINELKIRIREENKNVKPRKDEILPTLSGLIITPHLSRSYPENDLASNILGFFTFRDRANGRGNYGIEGKYDELLTGTPKVVTVSPDPNAVRDIPPVPTGADLILTIDREIQNSMEKLLEKAVTKNNATSGTLIVMDPKTGEILAMSSTPRMNLNDYGKYTQIYPRQTDFNRAIGTTYEPGSVFKILTVAAALDAKAIVPTDRYLDKGSIEIGGYIIQNWDRKAYGWQDITGCLQHSLNVCLTWIAQKLGTKNFYSYMNAFGIGHLTDIDLEGESKQTLKVPGDPEWYEVNLGTNSFGQGVAVTPIQMAMAASAIANDGKMMAPHLLRSYVLDGVQYDKQPQVVGMPITADTAHTLSEMLANSLELEASTALVPGYRVAGKTGTAEIPLPGGYFEKLTNASFVGWGPVDDPKFLVFLWLEKPTTNTWSSVVAAPVFSEIVKNLVVLMDIPPDATRKALYKK
jgi:cell division protein FtsI/penicillin-binding protein 2